MIGDLKKSLAKVMRGEVSDDAETLEKLSHDTSLFVRVRDLVVSPKDAKDVGAIGKEGGRARQAGAPVSLAARAAGSDMSGGPLTTGVVVSFTEHMNKVIEVGSGYAVTPSPACCIETLRRRR